MSISGNWHGDKRRLSRREILEFVDAEGGLVLGQKMSQPTTVEAASRVTKLFLVGIFVAAIIFATVATEGANASEGSVAVDSDGYVPIYSSCSTSNWLGYYSWYYDGYAVYGTIYINDCALSWYGAGPADRQRVVSHELGHARGYAHSLNPYSVMYPTQMIAGT